MLGRYLYSLAAVALLANTSVAHAAPKAKGKAAAGAKAKKSKDTQKNEAAEKDREAEKQNSDQPSPAPDDAKAREDSVKAAGTAAPKAAETSSVKVKEDKEGVKTYKFETVEVEGRLKSPQVIYFLRRVRAEFEAGALGHRSFMGELSDSRRSAAFR
jgi:hypothetical protein